MRLGNLPIAHPLPRSQAVSDTREVQIELRLGGGAAVERSTVTLYSVTKDEPQVLELREVSGDRASFEIPGGDPRALFYAVARVEGYSLEGKSFETGERTVQLVSVFDGGAGTVALSEPVTVATAYCFSRFLRVAADGAVEISDPDRAEHLALGMRHRFPHLPVTRPKPSACLPQRFSRRAGHRWRGEGPDAHFSPRGSFGLSGGSRGGSALARQSCRLLLTE